MAIEPTKYETLYLVRPDISPEDLLTIQNRVEQSVAANGGEIIKSEKWAERDLAYRIDNYTRGTYYIAVYASEPGAVTDIERYFNLSKNNVLRFMTVKYIEEQKPTGAGMSAPPQASGQEDQSAFQTPSLTAEGQANESAEPPQETQEQAEESQEEQPQETQEQAEEGQEEQPQETQEQAEESQEQQPQETQEQAEEGQEEQPQETQEQAEESQEQQPQETQEQAEEGQEQQPQETQEQAEEDQQHPQETQEQAEEDQQQPQENEEQTKGGSES